MQNHIQYQITESNTEASIRIYDRRGASLIGNQFATAQDVAKTLGVSRSSAYRIMQQLPRYEVEDMHKKGELHRYTVVKRSDLAAYPRSRAGNPRFADPAYQRQLAQRPRKKTVDK